MELLNKNLKLVVNNNIANSRVSDSCIEEEIYGQMLNAYNNRLMSKAYKPSTIKDIMYVINDFFTFTNQYPWEWQPEDFDDWSANLYSIKKNCESTQRHKQNVIARFQSFIIESPKFNEVCKTNFNKKPQQIGSPLNMIAHKVVDENKEKRSAFTREQLKCLWDFFNEQIAIAFKKKSKTLKTLQRDKVLYLIIYYYGLRANEASMLDTTDFIHNPNKPEWESFGGIIVRFGKSSAGSPPKRRTVWTISDVPVEHLRWYFKTVRPQFGFDRNKSIFLSERGCRLSPKSITRNLNDYLKAAGLPAGKYSTHSLRHSYISHLSEDCTISPRFIQEQAGHSYLATTQIYTHLSDIFVNRQLGGVIDAQISKYLNKE